LFKKNILLDYYCLKWISKSLIANTLISELAKSFFVNQTFINLPVVLIC